MAAANANAPIEAKQEVLATAAIDTRLALAIELLRSERDGLLRSRSVPDPAQLALARDPRKVLSHLRDLTIATIEASRSSFAFGGIEVVTESVIRQADRIPHRSAAELPMRTDVAIIEGPQRSLSPLAVLSQSGQAQDCLIETSVDTQQIFVYIQFHAPLLRRIL